MNRMLFYALVLLVLFFLFLLYRKDMMCACPVDVPQPCAAGETVVEESFKRHWDCDATCTRRVCKPSGNLLLT